MSEVKDVQQDELIRRNAERIARNEAAILRQTECLEKIRDHYFPHDRPWKRVLKFFLKIVGAVTVGAGVFEAWKWAWDARQINLAAAEHVAAASRLMFVENDSAGAINFLNRAVELDGNNIKYRSMRTYIKGIATAMDFLDLARPMTDDERERIDAIQADAVYAQAQAPRHPLPYVLGAQAYLLHEEYALAKENIEKAIALAPDNVFAHIVYCAICYRTKDYAKLCEQFAEAERVKSDFYLVRLWKAFIALEVKQDRDEAKRQYERMTKDFPRQALSYTLLGQVLLGGPKPDIVAARVALEKSLKLKPNQKLAMFLMGESYVHEGNDLVARLWYDRAIVRDARYTVALIARAKTNERLGDMRWALADWSAAIALDPFRVDLLRERAKIYEKIGDREASRRDDALADALKK